MAIENLTHVFPEDIVKQISFLVRFFQAIGGLVLIYLIWTIINTIFMRKRHRKINEIQQDIKKIKKKLKIK